MMQDSQALSISQEGTVCDHLLIVTSTTCQQMGMNAATHQQHATASTKGATPCRKL
jgi:hypothetical protein